MEQYRAVFGASDTGYVASSHLITGVWRLMCCSSNFDAAMAQQRAEIERLNGTISTLRQERDRVIMVSTTAY